MEFKDGIIIIETIIVLILFLIGFTDESRKTELVCEKLYPYSIEDYKACKKQEFNAVVQTIPIKSNTVDIR